ncbi:MAG: UDP-N-acetylglucosamine 2-epimerase, partial [Pseudobdellovibrionaceae bacterium]
MPVQSLSQLTSKLLVKLENHFNKDRPDLILAHGDTTTCFATAVSAFYHQIPFFHVEAGLRTHRLNSP